MSDTPPHPHGVLGDSAWSPPRLVTRSDRPVRADQGNDLAAHEYCDDNDVLIEKVKKLASMLSSSEYCLMYCGAGLSKSSGIPDYASKGVSMVKSSAVRDVTVAPPTLAHCVLGLLCRRGFIKNVVQQNHDGLVQKAGIPQEMINEIHGAWFDPSNPVVQFNQNLRSDLYEWMMKAHTTADMCLCLGTSLSGMNADRCAELPAKKFISDRTGFGTVIINLQQTRLDKIASLRIWAPLDSVFEKLSEIMNLGPQARVPGLPPPPPGDVYSVPYDENGKYDENKRMIWDLRRGAEIRIAPSDASNFGAIGKIVGKNQDGHHRVLIAGRAGGRPYLMGYWWLHSALRGGVPVLPIVNIAPKVWVPGRDLEPSMPVSTGPISIPGPLIVMQNCTVVDKETVISLYISPVEFTDAIDRVTYKFPPHFADEFVTVSSPPFTVRQSINSVLASLVPVKISIIIKDDYYDGGTLSADVVVNGRDLSGDVQAQHGTIHCDQSLITSSE